MSNYNINNNNDSAILKYIVPRLNGVETVTDNFCVAASFPADLCEGVGKMVYSYNGVTWKNADSGGQLLKFINKISYNGLIWLAGGIEENCVSMIYSVDGKNWLPVEGNNPFWGQCTDIIWANGHWFACGSTYSCNLTRGKVDAKTKEEKQLKTKEIKERGWIPESPEDRGKIVKSDDGKRWYCVYDECWPDVFTSLAFDGVLLLAGGDRHALLYSYDGECWDCVDWDDDSMCVITSLGFNNKMWVAGGINGEFAYSYNGYCWSCIRYVDEFSDNICNQIQWNGSVWVAVAYNLCSTGGYQIAYSHDSKCWHAVDVSSLTDLCFSVVWNGFNWVVGGADVNQETGEFTPTFIYSKNGVDWNLNDRTILPSNRLADNNNAIFAIQSKNITNYYRACNSVPWSTFYDVFDMASPEIVTRLKKLSRAPVEDGGVAIVPAGLPAAAAKYISAPVAPAARVPAPAPAPAPAPTA